MQENKGLVVITDLRTQEAQDAAEYLRAEGYDVRQVPQDVQLWDETALSSFAAALDAPLVGVIHPAPPRILAGIEEATDEQWAQARDEGPMAAWCVTKVLGGVMRAQGRGALIYLNSIHSEKPVGKGFLYSLGCGAVQMLNREVNQDYGPDGVNSYFVQRGITAADPDSRSDVSHLYYGVDMRYPQRKMPESGYLNPLLAFLLTDAAWPLAGSDLHADGGMTMFYTHRKRMEGRKYFERE